MFLYVNLYVYTCIFIYIYSHIHYICIYILHKYNFIQSSKEKKFSQMLINSQKQYLMQLKIFHIWNSMLYKTYIKVLKAYREIDLPIMACKNFQRKCSRANFFFLNVVWIHQDIASQTIPEYKMYISDLIIDSKNIIFEIINKIMITTMSCIFYRAFFEIFS